MRKTKRTPDDFVAFLQERLIPDYRESDPDSATADTLAEACAHIRALQRQLADAWTQIHDYDDALLASRNRVATLRAKLR